MANANHLLPAVKDKTHPMKDSTQVTQEQAQEEKPEEIDTLTMKLIVRSSYWGRVLKGTHPLLAMNEDAVSIVERGCSKTAF